MIIWTDKDLIIASDLEPKTLVRKPQPDDSKAERKDKAAWPYINLTNVYFYICYEGLNYDIFIPDGYKWDGASCPGFHHLPKFLDASMLHDMVIENKSLIGYNRKLSSLIFREMLIASGVWKWLAYLAYFIVDFYQMFRNWNKE